MVIECWTRVPVVNREPEELPGRYALAGLVDAHAHATVAADEPVDDILAKFREWFDRLANEFTRIVGRLAQATHTHVDFEP